VAQPVVQLCLMVTLRCTKKAVNGTWVTMTNGVGHRIECGRSRAMIA
jgi:hypothetical protein